METAVSFHEPGAVARFGRFTIDTRRAELRRDGVEVALRPKTFALLSYLAAHPGRVVDKKELMRAVWPGVVVNDESLSQCVRELRGALGDEGQALIKTVPRRGYLFEVPAESVPPASAYARSRRGLAWWAKAGALLAALALVVDLRDPPVDIDREVKAWRSVAVLPFADIQADAVPAAPVSGPMAASLVADLAKLPDTLVFDLASATAAAGRQPGSERTAREAGARHVLSGTAQRHGDRVQVYAQLASSRDGTILWSERFDYAGIADGAWQRDVSLRIARAVDWRMTEAAASAAGHDARLAPAEAVLRGQYLLRHWTDYPDLVRARRHFESVLAAQPQSAAAWAGVAQSHLSEVDAGLAIGQASIDLARHALARARTVNPDYLPAKVSSGILLAIDANPEAALRVFEAVAAANPIDPWMPVRIAAMKLRLGRPEEVQAHANAALRLSPFEAALVCSSHLFAGFAQYYLGEEDRAYEHMRMVLAAAPCPTQSRALMLLASLDALHGRTQEANEHAAALMRLRPHFTISGWRTLTAPGHPRIDLARQRFFEGLAKAGLPE